MLDLDDGFYDASSARNMSLDARASVSIILTEISALKLAVDAAVFAGNTTVKIDTTAMAVSSTYFTAWSDPFNPANTSIYVAQRFAMDSVIRYFTRLGYDIFRVRGTVADPTANSFTWVINW